MRILFISVLLGLTAPVWSQPRFPRKAEVVDVTLPPYEAAVDGKTDVTDILQRALDDHPDGNRIIYLPQGTYLISRTLTWPMGKDTAQAYRRTILQGQSTVSTVLRLVDGATGFDNPEMPRAVLYTGLGPALRYRNSVRDLTVSTGKKNPGAIGIRFNSAVQGTLSGVVIRSEDGAGVAGIDMTFAANIGPLLIKNCEVRGFQVGISTRGLFNGMTLEHVILSGQSVVGVENHDQILTIRGLTSRNAVPALINRGENASVVLVDSKLENTGKMREGFAVENQGQLFARNVITSRYGKAIVDAGPGGGFADAEIAEYHSHPTHQLCATPKVSLNMPIAETPTPPWGDPDTWVAITGDYGASKGDGRDDSRAIQQAIDDGAETIFFTPGGRYTITRDVVVRRNLRRIIGTEARIDGAGKFVIADGISPAVIFERFASLGGGIRHHSGRTLILKNLTLGSYESKEYGSGDVYLEDVSASPLTFHLQHVWARQLHMSWDREPKIRNRGGFVWILGLSAERGNTLIETTAGGQTEVLGAHVYGSLRAQSAPMFINHESALSVAGLAESAPQGNPYRTLIRETRKAEQRELLGTQVRKGPSNGARVSLFSGYIPVVGNNVPPAVTVARHHLVVLPNHVNHEALVIDDGRAAGNCEPAYRWQKLGGSGRVVFSHPAALRTSSSYSYSGEYVLGFDAFDGRARAWDTVRVLAFDRKLSTRDHRGDGIPSGRGADATISQSTPNQVRGRDSILWLHGKSGDAHKLYLRFDLSQNPGLVSDAALSLRIRPPADGKPVQIQVFGLREKSDYGSGRLGEGWSEDSLTWNNAPGHLLDKPGGEYQIRKGIGGGVDSAHTQYLGTLEWKQGDPYGAFFRNAELADFLKKDKNGLVTLILTQPNSKADLVQMAARDHSRIEPPVLYLSFIDLNKSLGRERIPGGHTISDVQVDPFQLRVTFSVMVAHPQFVKVEVFAENGRRVLLLHEGPMEGEVLRTFNFIGKELESGNYIVKVQGEAFSGQKAFYLLN